MRWTCISNFQILFVIGFIAFHRLGLKEGLYSKWKIDIWLNFDWTLNWRKWCRIDQALTKNWPELTYGATECFGRFYIHFPQGALILMNVYFLGGELSCYTYAHTRAHARTRNGHSVTLGVSDPRLPVLICFPAPPRCVRGSSSSYWVSCYSLEGLLI